LIVQRIAAVLAVSVLGAAPSACLQRNPDFVGASDGGTTAAAETGDSGTSAGPLPVDGSSSSPSSDESASDTNGGPLTCAPNLDSLRLTVFARSCTADGCHAGDVPAAALDLSTVDLYEDLLDVPSNTCLSWARVVAEAPEQSILYAKVAGVATCEVDRPVPHDVLPGDELECLSGWIETIVDCERCGGTDCIELQSDATNCGGCGVVCPEGIACVGGVCDCPAGGIACEGACIDPQADPLHCGGCGNDCEGNPCDAGSCSCVGLTECGGCVDTQTDSAHCGGCDQPCGYGRTCDGGECGCAPTPVSFAAEVQPILTENCVSNGCHGGSNPKKDLSLEAGAAWADLVDVPAVECNDGRLRVAPGDPENSYLMHKLLGIQLCSGVQMPQSGGPGNDTLADEDLDRISAWICQGAADN
jgi:hypothetical protein